MAEKRLTLVFIEKNVLEAEMWDSFEATAKHMVAKNHLYQGVGTYPIFVQGPETDPLNQNLPRREEER